MSEKVLFLSHIHEESELAVLIKNAIENEFGGFVQVFVSSDGDSIKAGENLLSKIESTLAKCIGAIYLLSPTSVSRTWISFELGAVWIRNVLSKNNGGSEIPAIPACHSGLTPGGLPSPLNNLNGITCSDPVNLKFAFTSLQSAVGGRGDLRTDFNDLALQVGRLERKYTKGKKLVRLFELIKENNKEGLYNHIEKHLGHGHASIKFDFMEAGDVTKLRSIESELEGEITYSSEGYKIVTTGKDQLTGNEVIVRISPEFFIEHKHLLK